MNIFKRKKKSTATEQERILKQALKVLDDEWKKSQCKDICVGCPQCFVDRLRKDLKSYIDWIYFLKD